MKTQILSSNRNEKNNHEVAFTKKQMSEVYYI